MNSRRILITGLSTYWGGRLAQALEQNDDVEAIIGVDNKDPRVELERTEYVRVGTQHALLRRLVDAAAIDTVIDTRLVVDSVTTTPRKAHENNVIGTMNILAACSGPDSTVRRLVFKSSAHYYGCEQDDPAFFTESMVRPHAPRTAIERDIVEAEAAVAEFAEKNPDCSVALLRFANVIGPDVKTSHTALFSLPVVPMILGFDPRYQFVHEDDVVSALEHVAEHDLPGIYNVGGDGVLSFTEVCGLLGKTYAPILPPWGTGLALAPLRRLGINIPAEMQNQLRYGRGLDNRKLKATGFAYRYTSREAVLRFGEHLRLHPVVRGVREPYRYEREVEEFLRWSPSVRETDSGRAPLTRNQLVELERLLGAYADTAGISSEPDAQVAPEPRESAERVTPPAKPTPEPEPEPEPEPRRRVRRARGGGDPHGARLARPSRSRGDPRLRGPASRPADGAAGMRRPARPARRDGPHLEPPRERRLAAGRDPFRYGGLPPKLAGLCGTGPSSSSFSASSSCSRAGSASTPTTPRATT